MRRDGDEIEVGVAELVLDDLVVLRPGDQISVDGEVLEANGLEVDESLLTGESDPVAKPIGAEVLSGAFVAVGDGVMRAAARRRATPTPTSSARRPRSFSLVHSELRNGINRLITWIGWIMIPAAVLLISAQVRADLSFAKAVQASVAGLVAMVPEGLVLLTSVAFALGAGRLARRRVLTQELAAIEGLARVDVVCLDKTGTLTEGDLVLASVEPLGVGRSDGSVADALAALVRADSHPNPSLLAIGAAHSDDPGWTPSTVVPFSSARKWSAAAFDDQGAWLLGAPDILVTHAPQAARAAVNAGVADHAARGQRVLLLSSAPGGLSDTDLPAILEPVALVVLDERRADLRARHHRLLRLAGRHRQGHLGRQPGHGGGRGPGVRRPRRRPSRSTPASSATTPTTWPTPSRPTACSAGSRRSRSKPWSAPCRPAATSWR